MKLKYVKVFGERNTGTNFVERLISKNTNLIVLQNKNISLSKKRFNKLKDIFFKGLSLDSKMDPTVRKIILNRLIDQQREDEILEDYGWKHTLVSETNLINSEKFNSTFFIFLIRNPWRFVSSLHKRPYNLIPNTKGSLKDFVDSCFLANRRDNMPSDFVENPVEFWNKKVKSYFECNLKIKNSMICYYEQVVFSPKKFLDHIQPFCDVKLNLEFPIKSTKKDEKTFDDYRLESINYNPLDFMSKDVYESIFSKLDKEVFGKTIYKRLEY